jgi:circadian clock protein KaiC
MRQHHPRCMVIDPLSAIVKVGGESSASNVAQRVLRLAKTQGISLVATTLLLERDPLSETTPIRISTIADTWLHLSYVAQGGERNRALTIVKSRGTAHSNQVRELVLSHQGVTLSDVYTAQGQVLMGTARWQREAEDAAERDQLRLETERKRQELETVEKEIQSRIETLKRELEGRHAELSLLERQQDAREQRWLKWQRDLSEIRGGEAMEQPGAARPRPKRKRAPGRIRARRPGKQDDL